MYNLLDKDVFMSKKWPISVFYRSLWYTYIYRCQPNWILWPKSISLLNPLSDPHLLDFYTRMNDTLTKKSGRVFPDIDGKRKSFLAFSVSSRCRLHDPS